MPNLFRNSSAVPKQEDEYQQPYPQKVAKTTNTNDNDTDKTENNHKDWFYGTEELLDALPRVWTRSWLYVLLCFSIIILPWTMLFKIDETGSARGRIQPKGATQRIDSQASGNITTVRVKAGETVKAGQILMELESDVLQTNLQEAKTKLQGQKQQVSQLELLKNQLMLSIQVQKQQNQSQKQEKMSQVNQTKENFETKQSTYNLQKSAKLEQVEQAKQAMKSTQTDYELAAIRLKSARERLPRYQQAYQQGAISQERFLEAKSLVSEGEKNLIKAQTQMTLAQSRMKEQQSSYKQMVRQAASEIQKARLSWEEQQNSYQSLVNSTKLALLKSEEQLKNLEIQITSFKAEIAQTGSQIKSLLIQLQQRIVKSPIDGTIFDLPITKPGSVVQPGQMISQIAPNNISFVLKAQMPSQESGFLQVGMPVKIKFDAYPFQDYGVLKGEVIWVSPNSKIQQTNQGNQEIYELEISLQKPYLENGNKRILLTPGQTANAEVIIRQRRVIDFILDPFKKLQKGGLEL